MKKRIIAASMVLALLLSSSVFTVFAKPMKKDPPFGLATEAPKKGDKAVLIYEDFEGAKVDADGSVREFYGTGCDDQSVKPAKLTVTNGQAHSGNSALLVSERGLGKEELGAGYNTINYGKTKTIGDLIAAAGVSGTSATATGNYYFSAWVKNVDPNVVQNFLVLLQYGGSGECYIPGGYYEVTGAEWTQIGVNVINGKTYFVPFREDATGSGIYPPRNSTTGSGLKAITRIPTPESGKTQTAFDFYIDDIVVWAMNDTSKLVTEANANAADGNAVVTPPTTSENTDAEPSSEVKSSSAATNGSTSSESDAPAIKEASKDEKTNNSLLIALIVLVAVLILGGAGFAFYFIKNKNNSKTADKSDETDAASKTEPKDKE